MVRLKGTAYGVKLVLDPSREGPDLVAALEAALAEHADFLQGSALDIDLGHRPLTREVVLSIFEAVARFPRLHVASIQSGAAEPTSFPRRRGRTRPESNAALLHYGTVRSGQRLSAPGSLVVVGDVNSGAEVAAGRDIVVTGFLRGVAHAGLDQAPGATIYAGRLRPQQLRIGSAIGTQSQDSQAPDHPEIAWLEDGQIVVGPAPASYREARLSRGLPRRTSVHL